MPYTIKWNTGGILWTFHGVLTSTDAIQANLNIYGNPRFDDLCYQIVDISGVEQFNVTNDALVEAAAMDEAAALSNPRLVVAVVASGEEGVTVAEAYQSAMGSSAWEIKIFSSMKDAMEWVGSFC